MDLLKGYCSSSSSSLSNSGEDDDDPTIVQQKQYVQIKEKHEFQENEGFKFVRKEPHVIGRWCGHIYLPVLASEELTTLINSEIYKFSKILNQQIHEQKKEGTSCLNQHEQSDVTWIIPHLQIPNKNHHDRTHCDVTQKDYKAKDNDASCSDSYSDSCSDDDDNDDMVPKKGWYVSLSRSLFVASHSVQSFMKQIQLKLDAMPWKPLTVGISTSATKLLVNDEETRSFLVIPVVFNDEQLHDMLEPINIFLQSYGLPIYDYNPLLFHISIASIKGDIRPYLQKTSYRFHHNQKDDSQRKKIKLNPKFNSDKNDLLFVSFNRIICSFGTVETTCSIPLNYK